MHIGRYKDNSPFRVVGEAEDLDIAALRGADSVIVHRLVRSRLFSRVGRDS